MAENQTILQEGQAERERRGNQRRDGGKVSGEGHAQSYTSTPKFVQDIILKGRKNFGGEGDLIYPHTD